MVFKTASRGAEEVVNVSPYIFWDSISSDNLIVWENLLFPSLALVGDQTPRKDDDTDFGCAWIQSICLIALKIKCYYREVCELMQYKKNHAVQCLVLGVGKGFLTNLLLLPKNF